MSNTLPDQIPPQATPWSYTDENGDQVIQIHWYLFLYGLWIQVQSLVAQGAVLSPATAIAMADSEAAETDSLLGPRLGLNAQLLATDPDTDSLQAYHQITNLQSLIGNDPDAGPSFRDLANALAIGSDGLLPDPTPGAQPVSAVTVGASPFTFTANFSGALAISGGTVSAVSIIRQGTSVPAGVVAGVIPVSRSDQVQITYTVVPTVNFLPT